MITLDTSGVIALLNARDPDHETARSALHQAGRPYLVPCGILSETAYLLEARMPLALDAFLADLESGALARTAATIRCRESGNSSRAMRISRSATQTPA